MEKNFWMERWVNGEIGFHQAEINPYLREYWKELAASLGSQVFVPLCGKSRDMLWLKDEGHHVLGVELSSLAVQAFFRENAFEPHQYADARFEHCVIDDLHLMCGDFFDLNESDLAEVAAVYDRASLVALPPAMRRQYVEHLLNILPGGAEILLLTFDYPQAQMQGPPFAVSRVEVESLYTDRANVRLLAELDTLELTPRFRERGLSHLRENIYHITVR
jgi:thiopurine S-methyltransferase